MKYCFPALLKEDEYELGFTVITFPDLFGIGSECEKGKEVETAHNLLEHVLKDSYYRGFEPTDVEVLKKKFPDYEVILVEVDVDEDDDIEKEI